MKELNVNPKMFGVTVGGDLPEFYDLLKQNAEYVYGATQWDESLPYPGQKEFLAAYTKKFKHEPSYHAAAGYARLPRLRGGGEAGGDARLRQGARRAPQAEDETAFGDYAVDPDGFQIAHKMVMLQWQDGKRMIVWPDELANGKAALSRRRRGTSGSRRPCDPQPAFLHARPGRSARAPERTAVRSRVAPAMGTSLSRSSRPPCSARWSSRACSPARSTRWWRSASGSSSGSCACSTWPTGPLLMLGAYTTFWLFQLARAQSVPLAPRLDAAPLRGGPRAPALPRAPGGRRARAVLAAPDLRRLHRPREHRPARLHLRPALGGVPDRLLRARALRVLEVARDRLRLRRRHHRGRLRLPPDDAARQGDPRGVPEPRGGAGLRHQRAAHPPDRLRHRLRARRRRRHRSSR